MQDMSDEIVEAVHLMYEDDPQLEADCMLFLDQLRTNSREFRRMSGLVHDRLVDMGRCTRCGAQLETSYTFVIDLESPTYRAEDNLYCPECGETY